MSQQTSSNKKTNKVSKRLLDKKNYRIALGVFIVGILALPLMIILHLCSEANPDIRFSLKQPHESKFIDKRFDENGNYVYYYSCKPKLINLSTKVGFIDKVEISPLSIETIPLTKVESIARIPISWNEEKEIEIKFFIVIPASVIVSLKRNGNIHLDVLIDLFDNTGKKIYLFKNGLQARLRFNLYQSVKKEVI